MCVIRRSRVLRVLYDLKQGMHPVYEEDIFILKLCCRNQGGCVCLFGKKVSEVARSFPQVGGELFRCVGHIFLVCMLLFHVLVYLVYICLDIYTDIITTALPNSVKQYLVVRMCLPGTRTWYLVFLSRRINEAGACENQILHVLHDITTA